ncbi:MAG: hypothetical protein ACXU8N_18570 [Telluria sp.]
MPNGTPPGSPGAREFERLEQRVNDIDLRLAAVERDTQRHEEIFTQIEDDLRDIRDRLARLEERFIAVEHRLDRLEQRVASLEERMLALEKAILELKGEHHSANGELRSEMRAMELRLSNQFHAALMRATWAYIGFSTVIAGAIFFAGRYVH